MTNHLPECPANWGVGDMPEGPCLICQMLRACEKRCDEKRHAEVRAWSELSRDNFDDGFAAGLDAAQDAVAAVSGHSTWPDMSYNDGLIDALAAIDALKEKYEQPPA